jgi:hypothetical protein
VSTGDVHIDRLALRVAGLDEDAARTLARAVAEGLAAGIGRTPGLTGLDHLRIELGSDAGAGGGTDELARQIVVAVSRALRDEHVTTGPTAEVTP